MAKVMDTVLCSPNRCGCTAKRSAPGIEPRPQRSRLNQRSILAVVLLFDTMKNSRMEAAQQSRRSLLVVDDLPTHQFLIRALLKSAGYDVDVVSNGREAIEAHQLQSYDLIVMDCYMPEVDGFEATRQIRRRERDLSLQRVPIIAFTADPTDAARKACIDAGMDDFLKKPCGTWNVTDVLTRWLRVDARPLPPG
jgi:CheY-like chemotaxis protein